VSLAAKLIDQLAEIREHNIATWRAMAAALAEGNGPRPKDLLEVAEALDIANPGAALEADAEALRERKSCEAAIALCRQTVADKLKPFGGNVDKLRLACEKADAEARRLRDELAYVCDGHAGYWQGRMSRLERENPRAFGTWPTPRPKWSDLEVVEHD
jgi:hypothetical protein